MAKRKQTRRSASKIQADLDAKIRAAASKLKKRGLAFGKTDLRAAKVTKKMRDTVAQLQGVLDGSKVAIKLPKASRYKYAQANAQLSPSGTHAIRDKEADAKQMIRRGMIATVRPLGGGYTMETIEIPVNVKSVRQLRKWVESGEPDRLKHPNEYFAFRLNGFASHTALPNAASMHDYLMRYNFYSTLEDYELDPSDDADRPLSIELVRVFPPDAWDEIRREEERAYKKSPEYIAGQKARRERKNLNRRISDTRARKQKQPTQEFATLEQIKRWERGQKLRQYDKKKAERTKKRAADDPAYAEKLRERRRAKEKRQRQKGKRK